MAAPKHTTKPQSKGRAAAPPRSRSSGAFGKMSFAGLATSDVERLVGEYKKLWHRSEKTGQSVEARIEVRPDGQFAVTASDAGVREKAERLVATPETTELDAALQRARERGKKRAAEILAGPEMLSAGEFASYLGMSRVSVNNKRKSCQLLALHGAKRGYRFPRWQVDGNSRPFAAIPLLHVELGNSWAVYRFLLQSHDELDGKSGLEALQGGRGDAVVDVAKSVAHGDFT